MSITYGDIVRADLMSLDRKRSLKIENVPVEEKHKGSKVTYVPRHAKGNANHKDAEGGTISSWNDKFIFVNYGTGTNKATPAELLVWG